MRKNFTLLLLLFAFFGYRGMAQCLPSEVSVSIDITTDNWGYEAYWELVPTGNGCGNGTLFAGGNAVQVGCTGANEQDATSGGYGNNNTYSEGPWCLTDGQSYDIISIDDWGDGGSEFTVYVEGFPLYTFSGTSGSEVFTFLAQAPLQLDAMTMHVETPGYANPGSVNIEGEFFNYGTDTITSLDIAYSIDGGTPVTDQITGLNLLPFTSDHFTHGTPWTPASNGAYTVDLWVTMVNGSADMNAANDTASKVINIGPPRPNIIDSYVGMVTQVDVIGTAADQLDNPRDLDFHPVLTNYELWVINTNTENSGGSTVTYSNAGQPGQTDVWKRDGNAWHFMSLPTGIAFGDNENFATSPGVFDANHNGGQPFTGPALWSSDPAIYAQPSGGNGSHLDMLHESPYSMGIAHDHDNAYWVFDGYNQYVAYYDFKSDHGPGNSDHDDGIVRAVNSFSVSRINDQIASHLDLDKSTGWLYIVDGGGKRILRMDVNSGTTSGTPSFGPFEPLAEYSYLTGVTWEVVADSNLVQPSGIAVMEDRLLVSEHSTGEIIIYDISTMPATELWRIQTGNPGLMGITIGPDGNIWGVNATQNQVIKLTPTAIVANSSPLTADISIYPNPAHSVCHVVSNGQELTGMTIEVVDMMGRVVVSEECGAGFRSAISVNHLAGGTYTLLVKGSNEIRHRQVLTISK